jgi:hypothetical protein
VTNPDRSIRPWSLVLALGFALVGCHQCGPGDDVGWDSALVGGACEIDGHCEERCVEGKDFPDGTCTIGCDHDGQCPEFTRCVEKSGGVCLLACDDDGDCRGGYGCHDEDRRGAGGKAPVCIDD